MEPTVNFHTQWRHAFGERVAAAYAADPRCVAVAIAGSVARGWADRHSDVEVDVYWRKPPTDVDRIAAIERAGSRVDVDWANPPDRAEFAAIYAATGGSLSQMWPYEQDEWSEHFYVPPSDEGVNVGVSAFLVSTIDGYLDDVLERTVVDDERQMRLAAIRYAIPCHGAEILARWKERSAEFPDALVARLIETELMSDEGWWASEMWAARGAHLPYYDLLGHMQRKTLRVLLALNRIYLPDPRFKWADRLIAQMQIAPPNLAERLRTIFTLNPHAAVQQMDALFYETLDLVRTHAPTVDVEIDTDFAAAWFRRRRPVWDAAPGVYT